MKSTLIALALSAVASLAATPDTSLMLKPDAKRIAASKSVENKKCPVSGDAIGAMGEGRTVVYKGKAVRLCCAGCVKSFGKDPAKFLAIAEKSEGAQDSHEGHHHP